MRATDAAAKPRMVTYILDRLVIVAYGRESPSDHEWADYLQTLEQHGIPRSAHLVLTRGFHPAPVQRRHLSMLMDGQPVPVAVLTSTEISTVSCVVRAMSWFNPSIRRFAAHPLQPALDWLQIPAAREPIVRTLLHRLDARLAPEFGARVAPV